MGNETSTPVFWVCATYCLIAHGPWCRPKQSVAHIPLLGPWSHGACAPWALFLSPGLPFSLSLGISSSALLGPSTCSVVPGPPCLDLGPESPHVAWARGPHIAPIDKSAAIKASRAQGPLPFQPGPKAKDPNGSGFGFRASGGQGPILSPKAVVGPGMGSQGPFLGPKALMPPGSWSETHGA